MPTILDKNKNLSLYMVGSCAARLTDLVALLRFIHAACNRTFKEH